MTWALPPHCQPRLCPSTVTFYQDRLGKPPACVRRAGNCQIPRFPAPDPATRLFPGEVQSGLYTAHAAGLEPGGSPLLAWVVWLALSLQLTGTLMEKCEVGTWHRCLWHILECSTRGGVKMKSQSERLRQDDGVM